ncbi:MAG: cation transporter [Candidatus Lokiarchaeota archaeon]|nr:cation transporter [Candidatus Lokiarchaeota archaeon]
MIGKEISEKFYCKPLFVNLLLLVLNLFLLLFKLIVSSLNESLALLADAFNNLTEIVEQETQIQGLK